MNKFRRHPSFAYRLCLRRRKNGVLQLEQLAEEYLQSLQDMGAVPPDDGVPPGNGPGTADIADSSPVACWVLAGNSAGRRSLGLRFVPLTDKKC